jgi:hypothetical protein
MSGLIRVDELMARVRVAFRHAATSPDPAAAARSRWATSRSHRRASGVHTLARRNQACARPSASAAAPREAVRTECGFRHRGAAWWNAFATRSRR